MTDDGFQRALAELLTVPGTRRMLDDAADGFAARFALTADELGLLLGTNRSRLDLTARSIVGKRLDFVRRALPATMSALPARSHQGLFADFIGRCPPVEPAEHGARPIGEARRFADYLRDCGPAGVPLAADLAEYEVLRAEAQFGQPTSSDRLLGGHVRLGHFTFDVITLYDGWRRAGRVQAEPTPRPTWLAVVRASESSALACFRLGERAYAVLDRLGRGEFAPDSEVERAVLRLAQQEGWLTDAGC
ncbi:hypothetical protein ALI144C_07290 [Actinosynnema sp. ALI-1.44]|uniref:hypothetical protein n=1 Tax=Actinosynnema sp. ALI-1.44 TaxID=1933779 RepID=UPI00097C15AC|nr:hypothetical protein [Actinosynnema sp. ALI-1.44]ONI88244.1 hypothetical protein ALI144C_07290 [Actinosynnema sp. ALI-1.44]